jgi:enamine deaminase RidA (YjgF/YER057c/UK114 family)
MYFLGGDRIYIKPSRSRASLVDQLSDCLGQLDQINEGKKIFKLNFFADTSSDNSYHELQVIINELLSDRFTTPVIKSVIAQPPLTCKVLVEAFYYDDSSWNSFYIPGQNSIAMLFRREGTEILIGNIQAASGKSCRENAEFAFSTFKNLLKSNGFPVNSIVRQWNYVEDILGFDDNKQRYQEFNNVRSDFYADYFDITGYPAATGIGMNRGGVIIEFIAINSNIANSVPVDNPSQVPAHDYSGNVLAGDDFTRKETPKFERARYLELFGNKLLLISGTASIRGEKTVGINDPAEQTRVTIENIKRLYSPLVLSRFSDNNIEPVYGHSRVYVKNRKDFSAIKKTFKSYFGDLPVVYIIADICRDDLLVEIEGKVILQNLKSIPNI